MIEMENVSKHFGTVHAVNDLTLRVPAGELFCFLGPNGAGKTTTIKLLCGLLKPTEGTIRIGGLDIRTHGVEARAITGYIPDFPFMYDRLTAAEFYEFTGDLHRVPRETVAREMEESFTLLGFGVYLVAEDGSVSLPVPHHAVWNPPPSQSEEAND